jgi:hypothetical protein
MVEAEIPKVITMRSQPFQPPHCHQHANHRLNTALLRLRASSLATQPAGGAPSGRARQ